MPPAVRILLVEDEPQLASIVKMYLERVGYAADICENAENACWQIGTARDPYALVLVDLSMTGEEMMATILDLNPELPMVVTSGYPFDPSRLNAAAAGRVAFLHKPFNADMLIQTVQQLLPPPASREAIG